ncbi:leucyl aminopeptidase [Yinghuangia sp. ASG 101]|uniref:leucyl aminopeptidase n=1 Tax=Yinghuangia sp. ASG 101 TaxID=2896848 RepID=UPI001E5F72CF|nr:leucyl aminopeptidase [Yinghuangia sp. ASG 101]UGQ09961.1 leucyl aminopeptidase [Yinghuangia sp. ASG 101]
MTTLSLSTSSAASLRADAIVIGLVKGTDGPVVAAGGETVETAFDGALASVLEALGATGAEGEITRVPTAVGSGALKAPVVVAVGVGAVAEDGFDAEQLRKFGGNTARAATGLNKVGVALALDDPASVEAVALGTALGSYTFDAYRETSREGRKPAVKEVVLLGAKARDKAAKAALERALVVAESVNRARDLVNTPPNDLNPKSFAAIAVDLGKNFGFKVDVLDEKALAKGAFGGILGVGQGSQHPPRLVRLGYTHPDAERSIALVGKGITYDSGGLSLKPPGSNETMKMDMAGAAAVLGAVAAIARLDLAVNVTGWLALAENMPSGTATRPGDVLRMYGGRTVEVLNTDAEGRLVLADAITRACEEEPEKLVDVATLTGAMMVALGNKTYGIVANDDAFRAAVHDAAERTGEPSWPLPTPAELRRSLDSTVADLKNIGERMGGGLSAGIFLREFVAEGVSWAHLDIAGPAFNEGEVSGYTPKGGTGVAVRTLVQLAADVADGTI